MTTTTNITEKETELFEKYHSELKYSSDLKNTLLKLIKTPEYQKIFEDYIFDVKLKQLVNELAITTAEPLVRKVQTQLTAIAYVQQMLKDIIVSGSNAESQLEVTEEEFVNYLKGENE